MKAEDQKGIVLIVNNRFYIGIKNKRMCTAWSLPGAHIFPSWTQTELGSNELVTAEDEIKKRGKKSKRFYICLSELPFNITIKKTSKNMKPLNINEPYQGVVCHHCGEQTSFDPALLTEDSPMPYCPNCHNSLILSVESSDDSDLDNDFFTCDNCDLPDACEDFGCAIKQGLRKNSD